MMEKEAKIYVAGHRGMVGSAIVRALQKAGYKNIIMRTSKELDLRRQDAVEEFLRQKSRIMHFWQRQKLAALWQTANTLPILCMTIWF